MYIYGDAHVSKHLASKIMYTTSKIEPIVISTYNIERSHKVPNEVGGGALCNRKERKNRVRIYTHKAKQ